MPICRTVPLMKYSTTAKASQSAGQGLSLSPLRLAAPLSERIRVLPDMSARDGGRLVMEKGRPESFRTPDGGAKRHFDMLICPLGNEKARFGNKTSFFILTSQEMVP